MKKWIEEELLARIDEMLENADFDMDDLRLVLDELDERNGDSSSFDIETGWVNLMSREKPSKIRRFKSLRKYPIAAIIILICLITTATAAISFGLHEKFIAFFQLDGQETYLLEKAVAKSGQTVTSNGVTVTIQQTLADSAGVYVLYEVTVPEEITLPDSVGFYLEALLPTISNPGQGAGSGHYSVLERGPHHFVAIASCYGNTELIEKGPIKLYLRDLYYMDAEGCYQPLIEGCWDMIWDLTQIYDRKTVVLNKPIAVGEKEVVVEELSLSPISLQLTTTQSSIPDVPASLVFKDGTVIPIDETTSSKISEVCALADEETMRYKWEVSYRFLSLIDAAQVERLILGEIEIPLT